MSARIVDTAILDGGWGAQLGPDLMWQQLEEGYDEGPDNIALICTHQSNSYLPEFFGISPTQEHCLSLTYSQLMRSSAYMASALSALGIKRGDTLVTFLPSSADWALCLWIAATLELTFVPLNSAGLTKFDYPLELLDKPTVVVVSSLKDAIDFDELYYNMQENIPVKIVCHEEEDFSWHTWIKLASLKQSINLNEVVGGDKPNRPDPREKCVDDNRVAAVLFTEGGLDVEPTGCPLTVLNIRTALVNQHITAPKTFLITSPSWSSLTLERVMIAWKRGCTVVFSGLVCMSSQLEELINDRSLSYIRLDSLEGLSVSGGVVSGKLLREAQRVFRVSWAMSSLDITEGFGILGWNSVDARDRTPDSVGTVLFGSKVKICDDKDRVIDRDQEGSLHVGGDAVIQRYLGSKWEEVFYTDAEGRNWFRTEYRAKISRDGLVYLTEQV